MAQCPTGYVGRLFWPCSHFSGFMGNGQNLWHPVHFCLEGRGHSAISYRTTGFPRLFFLFFHLPLAALSWRRQLFLPLSLSPLCISCNRNSRRFHENYLQIIFIGGLSSVLSLERISFFFFFDYLVFLRRLKYSIYICIYGFLKDLEGSLIWRDNGSVGRLNFKLLQFRSTYGLN